MALKEWLRPPRHLLVILLLLTTASVSALLWFGSRLIQQEAVVEAQRSQERLEQAADRIAATLRSNLAEAGERLAARAEHPAANNAKTAGELLLILTPESIAAWPPDQLLYRPIVPRRPEPPASVFAAAEALEFRQQDLSKAAAAYRTLAQSNDAAVRAGAFMRLARVMMKAGDATASRRAYENLAATRDVAVAGAPADLVARLALSELARDRARAGSVKNDLLAARWPLTRGQFEFYWAEACRLAGRDERPPPASVAWAEAAAAAWSEWRSVSSLPVQRTLRAGDRRWLALWRGNSAGAAVLLCDPRSVLRRVCPPDDVTCDLTDEQGQMIAESAPHVSVTQARSTLRSLAASRLPWTLYVRLPQPSRPGAVLARQRFVLGGMAVVVLFLMAGTYFIARAIRREIEVSRLQSDFVSAVSHEFRSPLTALRQLAEILAAGRVPDEPRRQKYYETLVGETRRLQRLVETLLNFGKMDAGARQYRFEEINVWELVTQVAGDIQTQLAESGRRIETRIPANGCLIHADREAMLVVVSNLLDNALKYSPGQPTVWIECSQENGSVAIRVRDRGIGIAPSEQKAIFQKFVRGSGALAANVRGTGVGLAMVRHIVAAHGGEIRLSSEPGQGSVFTVLLPAIETGTREGGVNAESRRLRSES